MNLCFMKNIHLIGMYIHLEIKSKSNNNNNKKRNTNEFFKNLFNFLPLNKKSDKKNFELRKNKL